MSRPGTRRAKRTRNAATLARPSRAKPVNTAIDPVAHPNWYTEDPTLRRGDIVVLDGEVLVFEGGRPPYGPESFTSLNRSRLLSAKERERIGEMAGLPADASERAKTRTAVAPED